MKKVGYCDIPLHSHNCITYMMVVKNTSQRFFVSGCSAFSSSREAEQKCEYIYKATTLLIQHPHKHITTLSMPPTSLFQRAPAPTSNVCNTPDCQATSVFLKQYVNLNVDPCSDFFEYSCGAWINAPPRTKAKNTSKCTPCQSNCMIPTCTISLSLSPQPETPLQRLQPTMSLRW